MKGRMFVGATTVAVVMAMAADPAVACGGLIGENGTIQLVRTTTLAAYTAGVERYVTAFEFTGEGAEVGSIIPLPDVPTEVVRGGDWTLQRLAREVAPPAPSAGAAETTAAAAEGDVEVLLETTIDALDITVLRGGGDEVGEWAVSNGFLLTPDAPEVLDFYARRSPVFMAAKFDATRAADLGQQAGDSTPIMATIPTDDPWVPIRILGLGAEPDRQIEADVFLLTDERPAVLAGGPGIDVVRDEPARSALLTDLRADVGMGWVPPQMWLTYMTVASPAGELDYDLAISADRAQRPAFDDTGVPAPQIVAVTALDRSAPQWPLAAGVLAGLCVALAALVVVQRRTMGVRP
jgi:hypothetical protein